MYFGDNIILRNFVQLCFLKYFRCPNILAHLFLDYLIILKYVKMSNFKQQKTMRKYY